MKYNLLLSKIEEAFLGDISFKPYLECVGDILRGNYVEDLEDVKEKCNEDFFSKYPYLSFIEFTPKNFPLLFTIYYETLMENNFIMDKKLGFEVQIDKAFSPERRKGFLELVVEHYYSEQ